LHLFLTGPYDGTVAATADEGIKIMLSVERLLEEARNPRLERLPLYARELIEDLARRMAIEAAHAESVTERAEKAAEEATALLTQGPAGSDTFMDLPRDLIKYEEEIDQRPLGTGVNIEFRQESDLPGEGICATWEADGLKIHGPNPLTVIPVDSCTVRIETR
jgi:hypothetical protein